MDNILIMDIKRYDDINTSHTSLRFDVDTYIPIPVDKDYRRGYITRYFLQKTNDKGSPIYEINNTTYATYMNKPHFISVVLKWRIAGPTEQEYDTTGTIITKSVSESNRIAISLVSFDIPNLKLYLPNLLQFHKK